ncbi:MAG: cation-transporting P-type ATPase, partial [Firmicutes bacterium]|nr:cation-transporting P-type ATPase [Bacillota bacterium]
MTKSDSYPDCTTMCEVVHALPGRLRVRVYGLVRDDALAMRLAGLATVFPWRVKADAKTGRALIEYEPCIARHPEQIQDILSEIHRCQAAHNMPLTDMTGGTVSVPVPSSRSCTGEPVPDSEWPRMRGEDGVPRTDLSRGLTTAQAKDRLLTWGANVLPLPESPAWYKAVISQLRDPMTVAFCTIAGVSFALRRAVDGLTMLAVVALSASVSLLQERRLTRATRGVTAMTAESAAVVRDGSVKRIGADDVVPGDIVLLAAGDRVAADGRVMLSSYLEVDESCMTGESVPVSKRPPDEVSLGTLVTRGRARVLVTRTGGRTQMGHLAMSLGQHEVILTPLQMRLRALGRLLVVGITVTVGLVVGIGILRGREAGVMWMTGLTLAASAIPEGLPVLITIGLTAGVRRVASRRAVVRKLSALETLGRATVICTDKTGTLTQNQMTVRSVCVGDHVLSICDGNASSSDGEVLGLESENASRQWATLADVRKLCHYSVLCSDVPWPTDAADNPVRVHGMKNGGSEWAGGTVGDPTELALAALWRRVGLPVGCRPTRPVRLYETPFSPETRRMSVICRDSESAGETLLIVKGAFEEVLGRCSQWLHEGVHEELTDAIRSRLASRVEAMANEALRVLCVAYRSVSGFVEKGAEAGDVPGVPEQWETGLVFLGFVGMEDPPRPQVKESIAECVQNGIRVVMITGDHPDTARAIARQVGLDTTGTLRCVTGAELDSMTPRCLARTVKETTLFARVAPHHKLAIVRALQARGDVVAMTGDGVNDAPAIRRADVGIAMGLTGSDVAKDASAMTLADDNFVTILEAIREGRGVLENIRQAVGYLLSGNLAEVLFTALAVVLGLPLPLLPIQILLVNLLTDGAPTLSLLTKPTTALHSTSAMGPLQDLDEPRFLQRIGWRAAILGTTSLCVFTVILRASARVSVARSAALFSLVAGEVLQMLL